MNRQRGQSLVEFAVGCATFVLLLLGVITLSGYQEVQRRGSVAARQFTYESAFQLQLAAPQAAARRIYGEYFDDAGLLDAVGKSRYVPSDQVQVSSQRGAAPGIAGDAASLLLAPLEASGALTGEDIDLDRGGYVSGELEVRVVPQAWRPEPFRALDLVLRQPYAVLSDAWNSGGASQVRQRTSSLVPTQKLAAIDTLWRGLSAPLTIIEPTLGKLCLGLIEPETMPEDRLGPQTHRASAGRICQ